MIEKSLSKAFVEGFEETMKEQGFLRKGKIFHRIVNGEIVQLLSYFKFSEPKFTIQFEIIPLCAGFEYSTLMDGSRVCELFKDVNSWEYKYQTDGYIQRMPEALKVTEDRLLPLLDSIVNYESYSSKRNVLYPLFSIMSPLTYMINMVLGNYEKSKESREALINYRIESCLANWGIKQHIVPAKQERFEQDIKEYQRLKKAMDTDDREVIEQYIYEQEQKSLKSYVKAFTTPKKYKNFLETGELSFEYIYIPDSE